MSARQLTYVGTCVLATAIACWPSPVAAADTYVPAGGNLQAAINAARAGDTIYLQPGATYSGNFTLPVHGGASYVTIRSAASDSLLPPAGTRMTPAYATQLPKIQSPNTAPAIATAPGAAYWRLMLLELPSTYRGYYDIIRLGDGGGDQNELWEVPHHLVIDRVYMHGDRLHGQKRGIALNSGDTVISNSYIADIKAIGQDSQAIAGWNGPGPYVIENNYVEGAAEVIMIGGSDPAIANQVPTNVLIRGNTVTRPLSWRDPIMPTPVGLRASFAAGGSLPLGTYAYRVTALRPAYDTVALSSASDEVRVTVTAGSRVTLNWDAVPDATQYLVYGRQSGVQDRFWVVNSPTFTDDGAVAATAGEPGSSGTVWQVKNLLELKNARQVRIEYNVFENNWAQAQGGTAIVFTPRNQEGTCPWCVIEDVTFEYNIVRGVGAGISILGWDDEKPSQQAKNFRIRHNLFSDVSWSWGGDGYFLRLLGEPRDIVVDHNTVISPLGSGVVQIDSLPVWGFVFTNNVMRHNLYGILGPQGGVGLSSINYYFPDGVVTRNVLADGGWYPYPAGNLLPSVADFEAHFTNYAAGDYSLRPGTNWASAGTDGLDLGAVMTGAATPPPAALKMVTTSLPATTEGANYNVTLSASGGTLPYSWRVSAGALPLGVTLNASTGVLSGVPTLAATYPMTVEVRDAAGAVASAPVTLLVQPAIAPVSVVTSVLSNVTATVAFSQVLQASGGSGSYKWAVTAGSLPSGAALSQAGALAGTVAQPGTSTFTVTVADAADATRNASRTFALTVDPAPNQAPTVSLVTPTNGATVAVGSTVTLTAQAADVDGIVTRVDFFVSGGKVGSVYAPPFTMSWAVAAAGTHTVSATAVDDRQATATAAAVTMTAAAPSGEVVLNASAVARMVGQYRLVNAPSTASGYVLENPNANAPMVQAAAAAPGTYAEFTFFAEAGRPYHVWLRGRADKNSATNDSVFVQFDGVAAARIGTTSALTINLEDAANAGVKNFGWQDNGYGTNVLGSHIYFEQTGMQTIRIQPREDGLDIDQIVLSPSKYLTTAPGALKNDKTIVVP